jgi:hypothetical protein
MGFKLRQFGVWLDLTSVAKPEFPVDAVIASTGNS